MEGIVRSMTNTRLMIATAATLFAGLVTAGAGVLAHSPPRQNDPLAGIAGQKTTPQPPAGAPAAAKPIAQDAPRPGGATPVKDRGPVVIQAVVVDPQGHGLAGVDVLVTIGYARPMEDLEWVPERAVSDHDGRIRVEGRARTPDGQVVGGTIWAYQPGRAIASSGFTLRGTTSPPETRLTLGQPVKRTITVLGPDDRPIEGLRLAVRSLRRGNSRVATQIPEELLGRLTVTTDSKGEATLSYLPPGMEPVAVQVAGPGIAAHARPLTDLPRKGTLKIGRTGRVVGIVRGESGQPLAGISVVVWVRTFGTLPSDMYDTNGPPEPIRFDSRPMTTGPQGAFQTPDALLNGSTYRVTIRQDGFAPFVSEWVPLIGERGTIPPIRLRALRKLAGRIHDRQDRPVGGARVFLPSGGPSTVTDAQGRFGLQNVLPDKTIVLVGQPGFRFQGWTVDPATQADALRWNLVRTDEAPDRNMTALAEPIPDAEARALANRVLEPYLPADPEKGDDRARLAAIAILGEFDMARAQPSCCRTISSATRTSPITASGASCAATLAETDPARAESLAESIPVPLVRAEAPVGVAKALSRGGAWPEASACWKSGRRPAREDARAGLESPRSHSRSCRRSPGSGWT